MSVKTICSMMVGATGLVFCATAMADESSSGVAVGEAPAEAAPPPTAMTTATAGMSDSKMRLGLNLVPMPFLGKIKTNVLGSEQSFDAAFAFGVMPVFDYLITPNLFVGVGPLFTFNVKGKDGGGDAGKEIDIMLRLGGNAPVADKVQLYGYLSPGYSIISPPEGDSAKGFVLGVHVGAMLDVSPTVFLNGELGYQLGFQSVSVGGESVDFKTSFVQIGLGGGMRI